MKLMKSITEKKCDRCRKTIPKKSQYYRVFPTKDGIEYRGIKVCCQACRQEIEGQQLVNRASRMLEENLFKFSRGEDVDCHLIFQKMLYRVRSLDLRSFHEETRIIKLLAMKYLTLLLSNLEQILRKTIEEEVQSSLVSAYSMRAAYFIINEMLQIRVQFPRSWEQFRIERHQYFLRSWKRTEEDLEPLLGQLLDALREVFINPETSRMEGFSKLTEICRQMTRRTVSELMEPRLPLDEDNVVLRARWIQRWLGIAREYLSCWSFIGTTLSLSEDAREQILKEMERVKSIAREILSELLSKLRNVGDRHDSQLAQVILELSGHLGLRGEMRQKLDEVQVFLVKKIIENALAVEEIEDLEQRFPLLSSERCPLELKTLLQQRRESLRLQQIRDEAKKQLTLLEEIVREEEWWPVTVENRLLNCLLELPMNEQMELAQTMVNLFQEFSERVKLTAEEFLERYPELQHDSRIVPVNLVDDTGVGVLLAFDHERGCWCPAWLWEERDLFPDARYKTERRSNRGSSQHLGKKWKLEGKMPVGTLLMISYPSEEPVLSESMKSPVIDKNDEDGDQSSVTKPEQSSSSRNDLDGSSKVKKKRRMKRYFIVSHEAREKDNHLREIHPRPREIMKLISFVRGELTSEQLRSKAIIHVNRFVRSSSNSIFFKAFKEEGAVAAGVRMLEKRNWKDSGQWGLPIPSLGQMIHRALSGNNKKAFQQQYHLISQLIKQNDLETLEKVSRLIKSPHLKLLLHSYRKVISLSAEELNAQRSSPKVIFVDSESSLSKCSVCFETLSTSEQRFHCVHCNVPTCEDCAHLLMEELSPCPGYLLTGNEHVFSLF